MAVHYCRQKNFQSQYHISFLLPLFSRHTTQAMDLAERVKAVIEADVLSSWHGLSTAASAPRRPSHPALLQNRAPGGLLAGRCVGVTQKSILATCNYAARRRGVRKLMRISEARRVCPDIVLVDGEDLSPFRDASKQLFRLVRHLVGTFDGASASSCPVERLGLDEVFVDVTSLIDANIDRLHALPELHDRTRAFFQLPGEPDSPDDFGFAFDATSFSGHVVGQVPVCWPSSFHRLLLGSHLAAYLRGRLEADAGYTASAGIATNKLLAKLAGKQHKPAAQTTLLSDDTVVLAFMDVLPLSSVTGIGFKTSRLVAEFVRRESEQLDQPEQPEELDGFDPDGRPSVNVTVGEVRLYPHMSARLLEHVLGGESGSSSLPPASRVWALLHGVDDTPVRPAADVPSQISIEDTYAGPRRHLLQPGVGAAMPPPSVVDELRKLATSLLRRMHVDLLGQEPVGGGPASKKTWLVRPRTLRLTLRPQPVDPDAAATTTTTSPYAYSRSSCSQPLPGFVLSLNTPSSQIVDRLVTGSLVPMFRRLAAAVVPPGASSITDSRLTRHSSASSAWTVGLLNVCVANMAPVAAEGDSIAALFRRQEQEIEGAESSHGLRLGNTQFPPSLAVAMSNVKDHLVSSGQHYSGANRVPNIKQFVESLDKEKRLRDSELEQRLRDKAANQSGEATDHKNGKPGRLNNRRVVTDPVTGKDVEIDDMDSSMLKAAKDPKLSVPNANLGKDTTAQTRHTQSGEEYRRNQDITAPPDPIEPGSTSDVPIHGEKTNVLFHPTPAVSYEPMFAAIQARANVLCAGLFLAVLFLGRLFGGHLLGLVPLAAGVASAVFLWTQDLIRRGRDVEWSSEQKRGETAVVNLIPESVEWLNSAVSLVWGLANPDMFSTVADTLEDVMQASVPAVIENVKVNDISQGTNPIRILSLRTLPDSHLQDLRDEIRKRDEREKDPNEIAADEEGGDFYNLEATVAYHSLPSNADVSSKARNMGMQLVFYLGIKGLFGVPFPVWVQLDGLVATVRLRAALGPSPPFIKTLSFTLMGLPKIQASCVPLIEKGANILNLPLISTFVNWAIATAAHMYVAPKSMTLDVGKMLQGDTIQKETDALGILFIRINKAVGLSKQDTRGSRGGGSDPYICIAFSKFGKPQYCTRVIQDNLNPIFSECAALLVNADVIRADEQLSLELWDSDRSSADDVVGKVELSIQKLIQHPGQMFPQVSQLRGVKAESTMPGELHWEVGFFGRTQFRRALRTDGKDPFIPKELQDKAELQEDKGVANTEEEDAVMYTPPDPLWPSGILSIVVHQIVGLELENIRGSDGNRKNKEYEPARPEAGELKEEQGKKLPSAYCTIIINDELVYKTRTKVVSSRPIFEAGTERFVRDWRSAIATITVRDSRHREHDPIIGVVPLRLTDILLKSSQSTRWYPIDGGIGFGRVRISLLFRSVELKLPPAQVSFGEVGTFEFLSDALTTTGYAPSSSVKIRMRTGGSTARIKSDRCSRTEEGNGLRWDIGARSGKTVDGQVEKDGSDGREIPVGNLRLPVQYRYRSPVFFEFHVSGIRSKNAFSSIWLQDLVDNEEKEFDVPVWTCDNPLRLSQSYITEENCKDVPDLKLEQVGRLHFRGRFKPGTDREHLRFVSDNDSRETIESWEACYAEGVRGEEVQAQVPKLVRHMHERSLTQGRDVLAQAPEEDKQRWLGKDGTDWTGAFGQDEAEMEEVNGAGDGVGEGEEERDRDALQIPRHHEVSGETQRGQAVAVEDEYFDDNGSSSSCSTANSGALVDLGVQDGNMVTPAKRRSSGIQNLVEASTTKSLASGVSGTSGASGSSAASGGGSSLNPVKKYKDFKDRSRDLHRKHRGLMQWKPMRNIAFAKDEATFAVRRALKVGKLEGRTPDIETEV
ncbi:c2 domain containing protein [Grosmannia clavigera kw1407]|uniref:C2 domain containing protein n=1 Tax=Grosmannia clavigera (strain kw1407 / UAMH 11150) TaxID=655863 RepID=F0X7Z7_GROCL|nr:c2 domain containing protein [Grosmannia clavigera kw1407]EFX06372.1 c2 domain containing protein [Grosmannia clavigera kw1407]